VHGDPLPSAYEQLKNQERTPRRQYVLATSGSFEAMSLAEVPLGTDSNGSVEHWHITSGKCLHALTNEQNQLYALDYRPDGAMFATAGKDQAVRVYDEATKTEVTCMRGG
jgi:WD40 repeat protein